MASLKALPKFLQPAFTLAILKPDLMAVPSAIVDVRRRIEAQQLEIVCEQQVVWTHSDAERFYAEHQGRFFYKRLVEFMASGPMTALVLRGTEAVAVWRQMLGPTHPARARILAPDTIRAVYGLSNTRNAAHGSDSIESAISEMQHFFPKLVQSIQPIL